MGVFGVAMGNGKTAELYIHEWIAIITITGFVGVLAICAYLSSPSLISRINEHQDVSSDLIEVFVTGSVSRPGPHSVPRGASVETALKASEPLPEADMRKLNLQSKLRPNQTIKVPQKKPPKKTRVKAS